MRRSVSLVLVLVLISLSRMAIADNPPSLNCGDATITIAPARMRGGEIVLQDFVITIKNKNKVQSYNFSPDEDILMIRCETNLKGDPVLLINHICGGSGCIESNFAVIDITSLEVLLSADSPKKGNHSTAERVLGKKINTGDLQGWQLVSPIFE